MKFRKRPVVIEAVQWTGTKDSANEILAFARTNAMWHFNQNTMSIATLEGTMLASIGDWVIRGVNNEFYPCKPDIFEKTYERVEE